MSRRAIFSLVNAALLGAALAVMFLYPAYGVYALYAIVGWVAAGLALTWSGWTSRPTSAPSSASVAPGQSAALPSSSLAPRGAPPSIDFCVFCGRHFRVGEPVCVECGHPLPRAA